jgi:hypothetical protein
MVLKDEKLGNYEVHHDVNNYAVVEKTGLNKKGEEVFKTHAYCSSMANALNRIAKMQIEGKDDTYDLKTYVKAITYANERIEAVLQ